MEKDYTGALPGKVGEKFFFFTFIRNFVGLGQQLIWREVDVDANGNANENTDRKNNHNTLKKAKK